MNIRPATKQDLDAICAMALQLFSESNYESLGLHSSPEDVRASVEKVIDAGAVFYAETDDGLPVGFISGLFVPSHGFMWNSDISVAIESGWYVVPKHRDATVGHDLLAFFEDWAGEMGADVVIAGSFQKAGGMVKPPAFRRYLEGNGYRFNQESYLKVL